MNQADHDRVAALLPGPGSAGVARTQIPEFGRLGDLWGASAISLPGEAVEGQVSNARTESASTRPRACACLRVRPSCGAHRQRRPTRAGNVGNCQDGGETHDSRNCYWPVASLSPLELPSI
jgi:hypothetical protein